MNKKIIFSLAFFSIIFSIFCIGIGSINIDPIISYKIIFNSIFKNFYDKNWEESFEIIIMNIRIPRVILGFITGASMSIVGVVMQTLTKNILAEPYILGISSGASTGAVSVIILSSSIPFFNFFTVSQGAFVGALISMILVFSISISKLFLNPTKLILTGIGISAFFSALTTFIIYSSKNNSQIITAMFWMTGSLSSATKDILFYPALISFISLFIFTIFSHELDIFLLGDSVAKSLGINIIFFKVLIILISTLLISTIVSITGIIGFVGLIIPHISRKIVSYKHINLLPFSFFLGGLFLVVADSFARSIFSPEEVPIGVITSFIGAPLFLWITKNNYTGGSR